MNQYYIITNDITQEVWRQLVWKFSDCQTIEMIEYFGTYSDAECRKISKERIISPQTYFNNNNKPDSTFVSMRPLFKKFDSFSFVYAYTLTEEIISFIENKWEYMQLESFSIKDEENRAVFNYFPILEPVILLGDGELKWAESIGLEFEKYNLTLNELID